MPIAIVLRKRASYNQFRDLLIGSLNTGVAEEALLCSGFFQENKQSTYQASQEPGFANAFVSNKIALTTIGIHNYGWRQSYRNFRDGMRSQGVNINAFYKVGMRWHSKVFILSKSDIPIFGIIGSSNITRNAFSNSTPFNNECDVILWSNKARKLSWWINSISENNDFPYDTIRASYTKKQNQGLSILDRLKNIRDEVLRENIRAL